MSVIEYESKVLPFLERRDRSADLEERRGLAKESKEFGLEDGPNLNYHILQRDGRPQQPINEHVQKLDHGETW